MFYVSAANEALLLLDLEQLFKAERDKRNTGAFGALRLGPGLESSCRGRRCLVSVLYPNHRVIERGKHYPTHYRLRYLAMSKFTIHRCIENEGLLVLCLLER